MITAEEIKRLRSGKGFYNYRDMACALMAKAEEQDEKYKISGMAYSNKEKGKRPFTAREARLMAQVLEIPFDVALEYFS